jgi:starch synthase
MKIVHVATEFAPLAKAGGLADMVFGLAKATAKAGHAVSVILPKYGSIDLEQLENVKQKGSVWTGMYQEIAILLLEHELFRKKEIYREGDAQRFIEFCKLAVDLLKGADVVHLHDWPTALVAALSHQKTVLTIHNLEYQGKCSSELVLNLGLEVEDPFNLLKCGIIHADAITTVSPSYEKEILTPLGGAHLDGVLREHRHKLTGILNGIDDDMWHPGKDNLLCRKYSAKTYLKGKAANRANLFRHYGVEKGPLVCCISRLVPQKGPELMRYGLEKVLKAGGQIAVIGTPSTPEIGELFRPYRGYCFIFLDYNEAIAHMTYAASDMILVPSIFEPCGLTQMIALKYGCIPIVRKTGGLADTIFDVDTSDKPVEERNGFVFDYPDQAGVDWALDRALKCYFETPKRWDELVKRGMGLDFSWSRSTDAYLEIYKKLS